ncbi:hypothetical protein [Albibacterium indicum]|uniref:hypothetical protein n=1 Tax=Albibacterium indicum TaxID=2292082 RepID=UPI000E485D08|nr:hypothetical protein [Pedobacter indicus]
MNQVKFFIVAFISLFVISCQQSANDTNTNGTTADTLSEISQDTIDQDTISEEPVVDTATSAENAQPSTDVKATSFKIREGKHNISLQWISWDDLGEAEIEYVGDNKYSIVGEQRNPDNSDYLKINGTIEPVSDKKLAFEGTIESQIEHLNQGQPCVRDGSQVFESTKNRKYWRMQDMENCEGGRVLDYVDIYF